IETLILQPPRVEHRAAAKAFPQDADIAAGNRYHHVRVEHDPHECRDHQVDHDAAEMAFSEPPPPGECRRRGWLPIWPQIRFHHLSSTVSCAANRPSSMRTLRAGKSISSI